MDRLSYQVLKRRAGGWFLENAPERVLQFGEGNFLRAFADYFIDVANEVSGFDAKVVLVQPRSATAARETFAAQQGLYTVYLRGIEDGKKVETCRVISCVSRCISAAAEFEQVLFCARNPQIETIISNTTEAGIAFCAGDSMENPGEAAFPGKLTLVLLERYRNCPEKGFVILPCELIDENGKQLLACVKKYIDLWKLPADFARWVEDKNIFCSTLVDRIVVGYPEDAKKRDAAADYEDNLMVTAEPFGFWAIEGPEILNQKLPFAKCGLPVLITRNRANYKQRKVRILNGAHTSTVCAALLCGLETVGGMMADEMFRAFLERAITREIIPTLDLPRPELEAFKTSVFERFENPFIRHALISITLNATSKWRARVLPSVNAYWERKKALPKLLVFSFAAYAQFFQCGQFDPKDDPEVLAFFAAHRNDLPTALLFALCAREDFWGQRLTEIPGFLETAAANLSDIQALGTRAALKKALA